MKINCGVAFGVLLASSAISSSAFCQITASDLDTAYNYCQFFWIADQPLNSCLNKTPNTCQPPGHYTLPQCEQISKRWLASDAKTRAAAEAAAAQKANLDHAKAFIEAFSKQPVPKK